MSTRPVDNTSPKIIVFNALNFMPEQEVARPFLAKTIDVWKKQPWFARELYNYFNSIKYTDEEIMNPPTIL